MDVSHLDSCARAGQLCKDWVCKGWMCQGRTVVHGLDVPGMGICARVRQLCKGWMCKPQVCKGWTAMLGPGTGLECARAGCANTRQPGKSLTVVQGLDVPVLGHWDGGECARARSVQGLGVQRPGMLWPGIHVRARQGSIAVLALGVQGLDVQGLTGCARTGDAQARCATTRCARATGNGDPSCED